MAINSTKPILYSPNMDKNITHCQLYGSCTRNTETRPFIKYISHKFKTFTNRSRFTTSFRHSNCRCREKHRFVFKSSFQNKGAGAYPACRSQMKLECRSRQFSLRILLLLRQNVGAAGGRIALRLRLRQAVMFYATRNHRHLIAGGGCLASGRAQA